MSSTHGSGDGKVQAGRAAADQVRSGMRLGLGTGSTVAHFLEALAGRIRDGEVEDVVGVPSSVHTEEAAKRLGIPLSTLELTPELDLVVDGADEVDPDLELIKGMGGALLREKMVAQASMRFIAIVGEDKLVSTLGTRSPLPIEVVPFGWGWQVPFLEELGADVELRRTGAGDPYLTDNHNYLLHCRFPKGIADPRELEEALGRRAGVVETGLFLGLAGEALVGGPGGVRRLTRRG